MLLDMDVSFEILLVWMFLEICLKCYKKYVWVGNRTNWDIFGWNNKWFWMLFEIYLDVIRNISGILLGKFLGLEIILRYYKKFCYWIWKKYFWMLYGDMLESVIRN